ncbi:transmembrane protein 106A [Nannospalax galili]|uniref:Transmembrane protein 106A n=1 Tax=Nannospalax galili TaxID=1026970 RepID=A0A8C6RSP8_NANGA|nr:transmembrane protein 106A [Nannospalax galili]XP_029413282.1 transmembrane protein 106A [Nannospalax galili]
MGKAFSQFRSQQDEDKSILQANPAIASNTANYLSTGSLKPSWSVPYERAADASFVTCPTCQGNGEIPQELEKQLVALIPYGDQRLKPRHTKLSVFLAVLICLLTFSFIIFFLFPRSIVLHPAGLNFSTVVFHDTDVQLNITNMLNISNTNFYPITVTQMTIEVLHQTLVVGQVSHSFLLHIGPLASKQMSYEVANTIWDENTYKICTWLKIKVHHVLLHIQGTLTYYYLSRSEQQPFESYEYVDCRGNMSVPHLEIPHPS